MTEQEIANNLDNLHRKIVRSYEFSSKVTEKEVMSLVRAKKLLEELEQYRALGMTPELIEAMQGHNIAMINDLAEYQALGTVEELRVSLVSAYP